MLDFSTEVSSLEEKLLKIYMKLIRLKNKPNSNYEKIEELEDLYENLSDIVNRLEDL